MGKADIISHAGDGLYNVQIRYNRDRYTATIAALDTKITAYTAELSDAELDRDEQQALVDAKLAEAKLIADTLAELYSDFAAYNDQLTILTQELITLELQLIELQKNPELNETLIENKQAEIAAKEAQIAECQTNINETQSLIDENYTAYETAANEANELNVELQVFIANVNNIELQITAFEKRKEYLTDNMPEDAVAQVWCADLTTNLTGTIGTVEIPGERGILQVQPGHEGNAAYNATRDGQLFPTISLGVAQALYNFAMFPGWQKWMPTFRHGIISNLNQSNDTATVTLDSATSSQQDLNINQSTVLTAVPIEYMSCNSVAFENGDEVLVMFMGQEFASPKVIGFKDNPKPCKLRAAWDAFNLAGEKIGYVICKGDGFQGPYELIETTGEDAVDTTDPFFWGKWLEYYDACPFDDIDEYLEEKIISNGTRTISEIPPAGTRNRIFHGLVSGGQNENTTSDGAPTCAGRCYTTRIEGWNRIYEFAKESFTKSAAWNNSRQFSIGEAGESGGTPDPATYGGQSGYGTFENTISLDSMEYSESWASSGTGYHFLPDVVGYDGETYEELEPFLTLCADTVGSIDPLDVNWIIAGGGDDGQCSTVEFTMTKTISYQNKYHYNTSSSSAVDDEHYAMGYAVSDMDLTLSGYAIADEDCGNIVESQELSGDWNRSLSKVEIVLDGESFQVGNYSNDDLDKMETAGGGVYVLYYESNGTEYALGSVLLSQNKPTRRFFMAVKRMVNGEPVYEFDDSVVFETPWTDKIELSGVMDSGGNQVYISGHHRLVRA